MQSVAKQFTLGKNERLKSRKAIEHLFREGKRFTVPPFSILYTVITNGELKAGVGVSTKNFKKAVDRNKIKRLVREAYRLQKNDLHQQIKTKSKGLHIFIIYNSREIPGYNLVYEKLSIILKKLLKKIDENTTPGT